MKIRRKTIDPEIEKKVLGTLITSDKTLITLENLITPDIFSLAVSKIVVEWVINYFKIYKKAPKKNIQDIYELQRSNIPSNIEEEIEDFLEDLSEKFSQEEQTNEEFLINRAEDFLKSRRLIYDSEQIIKLAESGEIIEAERLRYKERILLSKTIWEKPFDDPKFINEVFREDTETLLELGGGFNELIGPLKRGYLLGIMAFTKRGKTWYMQELADWLMAGGKRVAWISLEMDSIPFSERLYMKMSATTREREGAFEYPVLDCLLNQQGTCTLPARSRLRKENSCSFCKEENPGNFIPVVSSVPIFRPIMKRKEVQKVIKHFRNTFGKNLFRLAAFPANSANAQDILSALDVLEYTEDFIPDAIFIDYADLLRPEDSRISGREAIDLTWRSLKGMASERKALVVTVSQSNRGSSLKNLLQEGDTAEDIRKLAHVDVMLSLNQNDVEKDKGIMRIGVLEHRWRKFSRNRLLLVLQQLEVGQTNLDSMIIDWNEYSERLGKGEDDNYGTKDKPRPKKK